VSKLTYEDGHYYNSPANQRGVSQEGEVMRIPERCVRAQASRRRQALDCDIGGLAGWLVAGGGSAQPGGSRYRGSPTGHPDLSGIWENGAGIEFVRPRQRGGSLCVGGCGPAPGAAPPPPCPAAQAAAPPRPTRPQYKPEFQAKVADLTKRQVEEDPVLRCQAPGIPRIGPPDKIVQRAGEAVFLYDVSGGFFHIVPPTAARTARTSSRAFSASPSPVKGDTPRRREPGFNDKTWLTDDGAFHSTDLRPRAPQAWRYTLEWPRRSTTQKVLTGPWEVPRARRLTDVDLVEAAPCVDRDIDHIVDGSHPPGESALNVAKRPGWSDP
jgi:hypothetical protein